MVSLADAKLRDFLLRPSVQPTSITGERGVGGGWGGHGHALPTWHGKTPNDYNMLNLSKLSSQAWSLFFFWFVFFTKMGLDLHFSSTLSIREGKGEKKEKVLQASAK